MSKTLTLRLPDEIAEIIAELARKAGKPEEELALEWLARYAAKPPPHVSAADTTTAWDRLRRHAGKVSSGDARSADNGRIDEDLAREHADPHEDAR
jgi:predicted DNA-binding protein